MASSQTEGIIEQVRGRDVDPVAPKGRGNVTPQNPGVR